MDELNHRIDGMNHRMDGMELYAAFRKATNAHGALMSSMAPQDPIDNGNAVVEVRPGVGGREASIFAAELFKTYELYAKANKWRFEVIVR